MARIFLTGGTGTIGSVLLGRLIARGDDVVALGRSAAAVDALAGRGAVPVYGDVVDERTVAAGMTGCSVVFHLAGVNTLCPSDRDEMTRVNVDGAVSVVRAAARAGVERVVLTSSGSALGEQPGTFGDERTRHRGWYLSLYERSKHEGEQAAAAEAQRLGVDVVTLNPSSVQGPGRLGGTGKMLIALFDGRLPAFVDTTISIVDIDDCVEGHLRAAERGVAGERYVLSAPAVTTRELIQIVCDLSQTAVRVRMVRAPVARAAAAAVEAVYRVRGRTPPVCGEMVRSIMHGHRYDASRSVHELGLTYTPLSETLRRTADWAVTTGLVTRPLPGLH